MKSYVVVYEIGTPSEVRKVSTIMTPEEIETLKKREDVNRITVNITDTNSVRLKGCD